MVTEPLEDDDAIDRLLGLAGDVIPGRCAVHGAILITHKLAGYRHYGQPVAVVCPHPEHTDNDRERCCWCGGPLVEPGTPRWSVSERRQFCSANHRLKHHRAASS